MSDYTLKGNKLVETKIVEVEYDLDQLKKDKAQNEAGILESQENIANLQAANAEIDKKLAEAKKLEIPE